MDDKPWHLKQPEEFEGVRRTLAIEFPYLHIGVHEGQTVLKGDLPIVVNGKVVDGFEIEVRVAEAGPTKAIPAVREVGGRIPHSVDRHVFPRSGTVCLFVEDEFWYRHPHGMNLADFLRGPVTSFFTAQAHYELTGQWPYGERSHGPEGIAEFYYDVLETRDRHVVREFLELLKMPKLNRRARCPCGVGRRLSACHAGLIDELRSRIPRPVVAESLTALGRN